MATPISKGYPSPWDKEDWHTKKPMSSEPKVITIQDLFPQFNRWAIGFDPLFDTFKEVSKTVKVGGYPPYNIYKKKDQWILELAVAGFTKDDIKISVQELTLTVEGELEASDVEPIHKGIATRDFKQEFALAEYIVVKGAELKDGLLRITLEQELPEEKKPKIIEIA